MEKLKKLLEGKSHWNSVHAYIDLIKNNSKTQSNVALDSSKSLLESVAITILKDNGIVYKVEDSLQSKVKKAFNSLKVIKELTLSDNIAGSSIVGAFANIASQIGTFRNSHGFISHGRDLQMENFNHYLLDLSIDSSELLTCFLIKTHDSNHEDRSRIYYDNFEKFNLYLNETTEEYPNFGKVVMEPSIFLFQDIEAYKESYLEFSEEKERILDELFQGWDEFEIFDLISFLPFFDVEELNSIGTYICENIDTEFEELAEKILEYLNESEEIIQICLREDYGI